VSHHCPHHDLLFFTCSHLHLTQKCYVNRRSSIAKKNQNKRTQVSNITDWKSTSGKIAGVKRHRPDVTPSGFSFVFLVAPLVVWYVHALLHYLRSPKTIYIVAQSGPGRMGNQLFQYASVLGIYEDRQRHNPYQDEVVFCIDRKHPFTLLEQIFQGPFPPCPENMPLLRHLDERGYGIYTKFDETRYCSSSSSQGSCAFTFGPYLQSYKYLQLSGKSIRSALTFASHHRDGCGSQGSIDGSSRPHQSTQLRSWGYMSRRGGVLEVPITSELHRLRLLRKAMQHYETEFRSNVPIHPPIR
jgi:hypothetical protein